MEAKLDLTKAATALAVLARLGLAKQNEAKRWHATARGKICRYNAVPDRLRRDRDGPGTHQRVRQQLSCTHKDM